MPLKHAFSDKVKPSFLKFEFQNKKEQFYFNLKFLALIKKKQYSWFGT